MELVRPLHALEIDGHPVRFSSAILVTDGTAGAWRMYVSKASGYGPLETAAEHYVVATTVDGALLAGCALQYARPSGRLRLIGAGDLERGSAVSPTRDRLTCRRSTERDLDA
jgi:hypothetical protein